MVTSFTTSSCVTASNSSNQISPGVLFKPRRYTYFFNNQPSSSSRHLKVSNMTKYSNRAGLTKQRLLNQHKQNLVCNLMKYFVKKKKKTKVLFLNQWHFFMCATCFIRLTAETNFALWTSLDPWRRSSNSGRISKQRKLCGASRGLVLDNIYMKGRAALLMFFPPSLSLCV